MIRRFNYTRRGRIAPERISIRIYRKPNASPTFDARLSFDGAPLPTDASVFIEAYYKASYMRFNYGTVANITPAPGRELSDFDADSAIFFRVKVVDRSTQLGRLVAELDDISPVESGQGNDGRYCILPVSFKDLGHEIWRLKLDSDRPVLEVNHLEGMEEFVKNSPLFLSLVYPAVIREVLQHLLLVEKEEVADDDTTWKGLWLKFSRQYHTEPVPPLADDPFDRQQWIDEVVRGFSETMKVREKFTTARNAEGS